MLQLHVTDVLVVSSLLSSWFHAHCGDGALCSPSRQNVSRALLARVEIERRGSKESRFIFCYSFCRDGGL